MINSLGSATTCAPALRKRIETSQKVDCARGGHNKSQNCPASQAANPIVAPPQSSQQCFLANSVHADGDMRAQPHSTRTKRLNALHSAIQMARLKPLPCSP